MAKLSPQTTTFTDFFLGANGKSDFDFGILHDRIWGVNLVLVPWVPCISRCFFVFVLLKPCVLSLLFLKLHG